MAQLNSTVVHGALNVTADISGGAVYSNGAQCLTGHQSLANYVTGPSSVTANRVVVFNGAGGKSIKDSGYFIDASVPSDAVFTDHIYTAGTNVSISASNVISATDTTYANATTSAAGLMSAADKIKLNGISSGATTYGNATTSSAGLMSTAAQTFAGAKTFNTGVSAVSFTATSSRKAKKDISPSLISALDIIKDTEIVDFKYINDTEDIPHIGFIAEDTPEILSSPEKDRMDMVNCIGILMKAVQEITKGMEKLEKQVDELKK